MTWAPSGRPGSLRGEADEFCSTGQPAGGPHAVTVQGVSLSHPEERVLVGEEGAPLFFSQNLELVVGVPRVISWYPRKYDFFTKIMADSSTLSSTSCSLLPWDNGFEASSLYFLFLPFIFCFRFGLSNILTFQIWYDFSQWCWASGVGPGIEESRCFL